MTTFKLQRFVWFMWLALVIFCLSMMAIHIRQPKSTINFIIFLCLLEFVRRSTLLKDYDDHISKKWAVFLKNHQFNFNYKVQRLLWFSGLIVTLAIAIYLLTQFQTKNGTIAFVILIIVVGVAFYLKRVATRNYDDHVRQYFHSLYADI